MDKLKLMTHAFRKICTDNRDSDNKLLILAEIKDNKKKLNEYTSSQRGAWCCKDSVIAMLHSLDWLIDYYEHGSGTSIEWHIYANYAYGAFSQFEKDANEAC
jgi:hypothetical protein